MVLVRIDHHIVLLAGGIEAVAHLHAILEMDIIISGAVDDKQSCAW